VKTMTYRDLLLWLERRAAQLEDGELDMEVIVRVQNDDGETMVGGLFTVAVDPGCTEIDALVLDGSTEAEPRHAIEEYMYGAGESA
jgi:hypothetical protein